MTDYTAALTAAAGRSLQALPPRVAEALVAFIFEGLAANPRLRGKPLERDLEGLWSARRGDYRILYRLDDDTKTVHVIRIAHRADAYRRR
ncbi:MAG: type II toxin-antitoxin system RelE family toxin [Micromonosporaceae bacterium]